MLPIEINNWFNNQYGQVELFTPASGGCINNGGTIKTGKADYFIKWNSCASFPNMFNSEAKGLKLLSQSSFQIPEVIDLFEGQGYDALLLENIPRGVPSRNFWESFGQSLAEMHRITNETYGLDHNNYMGSLKQENEPLDNWIDFFIARRLWPQVSLASSKGYFSNTQLDSFDQLYKKLPQLLTNEVPALIHGDLWNGNFMINKDGKPVLIDPAVSFSHREADLAMTKLFGGFDSNFYNSYFEVYPTDPGLQDRMDIYNLYPLLIHLNLFGSGYYNQVMYIVRRFQ